MSTNDNWWRSAPRSSREFETRGEALTWPDLSSAIQNRKRSTGRRKAARISSCSCSCSCSSSQTAAGCCNDGILGRIIIGQNESAVDRSSILDNEGYPKLGQRISKRKFPTLQNQIPEQAAEFSETKSNLQIKEGNEDSDNANTIRKFSKRSRRSAALICIDLKKVLERQRSLSESQTSSTAASSRPRRVELNLNLSIRNPLDSTAGIIKCRKGKLDREIPRAKRISKLKKVIFREREFKKQLNILKREKFDFEKIQAMTKDVSEIDFNRLKICGEPKMEVKIAKKLAIMSLFDNKYRIESSSSSSSSSSNNFIDDDSKKEIIDDNKSVDVVKRLENLLISREELDCEDVISREIHNSIRNAEVSSDNECEYFDDDSNIVRKTFSLKICDETGETVKEFNKPQINPSDTESDNICNIKIGNADENDNQNKSQIQICQNPLRSHSKNFREYCTNDLTPGLNKASENFLSEIYRLQKRMYERDEVKGRSKRRFYAGFKEIIKHVETNKIKFVFIAPDLEGVNGYHGGLDEFVLKLITACKMREIVFCFSLNKRKLGYHTHKKGSVSCVGITNYSGLEEIFKDLLTELIQARNSYERYNDTTSKEFGENTQLNQSLEANQDWNEEILSTRINLLLKSLQTMNVTPCIS